MRCDSPLLLFKVPPGTSEDQGEQLAAIRCICLVSPIRVGNSEVPAMIVITFVKSQITIAKKI